jgi:dephospho-CoA kinase
MRIGLTGNIASGKGEVARLLAAKGCTVVDADTVAHDLYRDDTTLVARVVLHFGAEVLAADGSLDRKALGDRVFSNPEALAALNALVRPALQDALVARLAAATSQGRHVVLDAALILEWGWEKNFDALWVVFCPEATRLRRLMQRNGLTESEAHSRIASQIPEARKRAIADCVLDNGGDLAHLAIQVDKAWAALAINGSPSTLS